MRFRFGSFWECLKQAFQMLYAHKFRSVLTVLGVVVGTTTTIAVASIVTGMNSRVSEMIERFGTNIAFISKWESGPRFNGGDSREEAQRKPLTFEDGEAVKELPHVQEAVACLGAWPGNPDAAVIKYRDKEAKTPVLRGGGPTFFSVRSMNLKKGRFYSSAEDDHAVPVAVIGYDLADTIFPGVECIDKEITINGQLFRVVGMLDKSPGKGLFGSRNWEDNAAIIPLGTFRKMYPRIDDYVLVVKAAPGHMDQMLDEVSELLRRRRKVTFNQPDNFGISTAKSDMEGFGKISFIIGVAIIPISGMGFLIGAIGVLNIMLVSVTERTKEIGTRRALGARRSDIIVQFLIEAMSLTGLGGLIGIAIGWLLSWFLNSFVPVVPSLVSTFWIVVGFSAAVSVGLIAGIFPAIKAAWLDPVEALRYE
ncbi:MAG: ABC transporter permease [Blastocatellia bacterium]|nr:ABC transporter permease [Blastocatellia bacterium]